MKKAATLVTFFVLLASSASYAQTLSGNKARPYILSIQALQDVSGRTDVVLGFDVASVGFTAPASAKHIQLKSLDTIGTLRWTKNIQDAALTVEGALRCSFKLEYPDMVHRQPIKAQVEIQNGQTVSTKVLRAEGIVLRRPDFLVHAVNAPASVPINASFQITADLKEVNGDIGGKARVSLLNGTNEIDVIPEASIGKGGTTTVVFTAQLPTAGVHNLKIAISDVLPGDFDLANNSYPLTIEATAPTVENLQTSSYASYDAYDFTYWEESNNGYLLRRLEGKERYENFTHQNRTFARALTWPLDKVKFAVEVNGVEVFSRTEENIEPGSVRVSEYATTKSMIRVLSNGSLLFVSTNDIVDNSYQRDHTEASVLMYAGEEVFLSTVTDSSFNPPTIHISRGAGESGVLLNPAPTTSVVSTLMISDEGFQSGGTMTINLETSPVNEEWNYQQENGDFYRGSRVGVQKHGVSIGTFE